MSRKVAADLLDPMNHATCRISGTETLLHGCCDGIPGFLPEHFVCACIAQYDELAPGRDDEKQDGIALRRACKSLALERTLCGAADISQKWGATETQIGASIERSTLSIASRTRSSSRKRW